MGSMRESRQHPTSLLTQTKCLPDTPQSNQNPKQKGRTRRAPEGPQKGQNNQFTHMWQGWNRLVSTFWLGWGRFQAGFTALSSVLVRWLQQDKNKTSVEHVQHSSSQPTEMQSHHSPYVSGELPSRQFKHQDRKDSWDVGNQWRVISPVGHLCIIALKKLLYQQIAPGHGSVTLR